MTNEQIAVAIEACDWTGVPIGNKAVLQSAIEALLSSNKDRSFTSPLDGRRIDPDALDAKYRVSASIADTAAWMTADGERVITDATKRTMPRAVQEPYTVALVKSGESIADTAGAKPIAQWQTRLRDPHLPMWSEWINVSEDGARTVMNKYPDVYEVRALVLAAPPAPSVADQSGDTEVECSCPSDECDVRTLGLTGSYYLRKCADLRATKNGDGHAK